MDLTGRRVGRLTVSRKSERVAKQAVWWECRCECGNEVVVRTVDLTRTKRPTRSCGCLRRDRLSETATTHGMSRTPEFNSWSGMIARCSNPNSKSYPRYGGRGITVSPKWRDSFASFYADVGPRPGPGYSLDRIDPDGNYEPGNCRWASTVDQARNKAHNTKVQGLIHKKNEEIRYLRRLLADHGIPANEER